MDAADVSHGSSVSSATLSEHPSLQPDEVAPGLYLSNVYTEGMLTVLQKYGITHVLQVGVPGVEVVPHHLGLLHYGNIPLVDRSDEDLVVALPDALAYIDTSLHSGGKLLVHCVHGQSRSAAVVIAYLMWQRGWDYPTALEHVRQRRPRVRPNDGFEYQLRLLHQMGLNPAAWPGWDDAALLVVKQQATQQLMAGTHEPLVHPYQVHGACGPVLLVDCEHSGYSSPRVSADHRLAAAAAAAAVAAGAQQKPGARADRPPGSPMARLGGCANMGGRCSIM